MNKARIFAIALCLAIMVLPSAAIPFFRRTQSDAENRMLADDPWLYDSEEGINDDFSRDFEAWLCDHFAFREAFVRANALLNYRLLHTSVNEDVIAGKGDWLYYVESVPDYTGEGRLTDDELEVITENLRAMGETLEENGAKLYVAIVPNKSTVYPEYMPERYPRRGDEGNIALLRDACAELPLTWIDLATPLMEAAGQDLIYFHTDTHWNDLGASLAARVVLEGMGREAADTRVVGSEAFRSGDLARLMGLNGVLEETVPVVVSDAGLSQEDFSQREIAVDVQTLAPTPKEVTVLILVKAKTGYDGPAVRSAVAEAVRRWFDGKALGQSVLLARLGEIIFRVDGVENYSIVSPGQDVAVAAEELPVLDTLSVEELR